MSFTLENIKSVAKEFRLASDRAAAIVGGAFIDEVLADILRACLVQDGKGDKNIFSSHGPLSAFSGKIDICFRFGFLRDALH